MLKKLIEDMESAIYDLRRWSGKTIRIFHHNDADGLCSGAILTRAFQRKGYQVERCSLEKPYPALLKKIFQEEGGILIFADFAGRIAPLLSQLNRGRNLILILDHHVAEVSTDPKVYNLDPELYGLKGDRDITASTTCFFFAQSLDPVNRDLAHIATLGAVGDKFFVEGRLVNQNREVALQAAEDGMLEIKTQDRTERYLLRSSRGFIPCDELGLYLDTLGGAGYYLGGPDVGVNVCLEGVSSDSDRMVDELNKIKTKAFETALKRLQGGALKKSPHIQWFHLENSFVPMGVKMVGLFCETIKNADFIDPRRYIAGFQTIPNEIPGFGSMGFNEVKISMRVSPQMEEAIRAGRAMGLDVLLPEATNRLGGFSDACHSLTAATTVTIGKEEKLIGEMERIFSKRGL